MQVMPSTKFEWKKSEPQWYAPAASPQEVDVPEFGFFAIDGSGDPNGPEFAAFVEALYALAYGVRMSARSGLMLPGYFEATVYPLEGVWDLAAAPVPGAPLNKDDLVFTLMIRQPGFVDEAAAAKVFAAVSAKKKVPRLDQVRFERLREGRCVQVLHVGPYDDEPASFRKIQDFCRKESLARVGHRHREVYLSDPRRTEPQARRTVLRVPVRDNFACD
jgi:hypothetical protein